MKNQYKDIYSKSTDWTYTYECPECYEPVPLSIDLNSAPFARELIGQCQNCNLDIKISEKAFEEWELNQQGVLSQSQEDFINEPHKDKEE